MKLHVSILVPLSFFALSCSDAPPQPPAIGLELVMQPPYPQDNPDNRRCQVQPNGNRSYVIGKADGDHTVEDGKSGVDLTCTVRDSGQVAIELVASNQAQGLPGTFSFNFTGEVRSTSDATQNSATLGFFDPDTGPMNTPISPVCAVSPPPGGMITKKAGALIAAFTCPLLVSPGNPGDGCRASGTVAVEYCKTGEEDD